MFEPCFLQCNVNGCIRTFTFYKVLRKHIKKTHICHDTLKEVFNLVCVKNKFYLIPIEKTLKLVLKQPETWKILKRVNESANDIAEDWLDGKHGRQLKTYAKHYFPNSIHVFIQIYFDEVETTNLFGSKTGIHKLGAFYFIIKNFPPAVNSALSNIHLLALAHSEDIKRYTTDPVMEVIVQQLKDL